ncbi:MAG: hypothetical protein AB7K09_10140 [Planctomycetota bacterium]
MPHPLLIIRIGAWMAAIGLSRGLLPGALVLAIGGVILAVHEEVSPRSRNPMRAALLGGIAAGVLTQFASLRGMTGWLPVSFTLLTTWFAVACLFGVAVGRAAEGRARPMWRVLFQLSVIVCVASLAAAQWQADGRGPSMTIAKVQTETALCAGWLAVFLIGLMAVPPPPPLPEPALIVGTTQPFADAVPAEPAAGEPASAWPETRHVRSATVLRGPARLVWFGAIVGLVSAGLLALLAHALIFIAMVQLLTPDERIPARARRYAAIALACIGTTMFAPLLTLLVSSLGGAIELTHLVLAVGFAGFLPCVAVAVDAAVGPARLRPMWVAIAAVASLAAVVPILSGPPRGVGVVLVSGMAVQAVLLLLLTSQGLRGIHRGPRDRTADLVQVAADAGADSGPTPG